MSLAAVDQCPSDIGRSGNDPQGPGSSIFWTADNNRRAEMKVPYASAIALVMDSDRYRLRHFTFSNSHLAST
jgi:hypothetical protein